MHLFYLSYASNIIYCDDNDRWYGMKSLIESGQAILL